MQLILSLKQVIIVFLLMLVGFGCKKADFIHDVTVKDLTNLLLYIVSPCLIINSFLVTFSKKNFKIFLLALLASVVVFIIGIIIAKLFFGKEQQRQTRAVLKYSTVYSNAGFMGIPLVQAFLGSKGVFFSVPFLVVYNLFMWSHGIRLFTSKDSQKFSEQVRSLIFNPNIIAAILGIIIYLIQFKLPNILHTPLIYLVNVNTPLSMLVIGSNLSKISLREVFNDKTCWKGTMLRNLFVPLISMIVLKGFMLNKIAYVALVIMISCPVAGVVVLFSILNNFDVKLPTKLLCLSTIVSVITIPLMLCLADLIS